MTNTNKDDKTTVDVWDNPLIYSLESNPYLEELEQEEFEWHVVNTSDDDKYDVEDPDAEYFDS